MTACMAVVYASGHGRSVPQALRNSATMHKCAAHPCYAVRFAPCCHIQPCPCVMGVLRAVCCACIDPQRFDHSRRLSCEAVLRAVLAHMHADTRLTAATGGHGRVLCGRACGNFDAVGESERHSMWREVSPLVHAVATSAARTGVPAKIQVDELIGDQPVGMPSGLSRRGAILRSNPAVPEWRCPGMQPRP
eukprot:jgi/Ulvmu1/10132/UM006_0086.1